MINGTRMNQPIKYGGLIMQMKKSESGYFLLTRFMYLTCSQIIHISYQQNKRISSTKRIRTGRIFSKIESKHKKKSRLEVSLALFHKRRKKHVTSNHSKERKVNKKMLLFYMFVKKMSIWLT